MISNHCQMRVKQAVEQTGAQVNSTEPGAVNVSFSSPDQLEQLSAAIEKAGYPLEAKSSKEVEAGEETLVFTTNIHCGGCLSSVSPALDQANGICHWNVDLQSPTKTLEVHSNGITAEEVMELVRSKGYKIEPVQMASHQ